MATLSRDEFREQLRTRQVEDVVRDHVFAGDTWAFRKRPADLATLRSHLSERLAVSPDNVVVVGSGKTGFSLSPDNFGRAFSEESDVDVLIVDEVTFDAVWTTLLRWHYPRRVAGLGGLDAKWGGRRRHDVYWGWFMPAAIRVEALSFPEVLKPIRDISTTWFSAFKSLSTYKEFASRDFSGKLYRTWSHALLYQADCLRQVANTLDGG